MAAPHNYSRPQMGATFHPGSSDGYHMPEVISPAPKRVMPEVPENMQDNIAHLEHEASGPPRRPSQQQQQQQQTSPRYDQTQFPARNSSRPAHGYPQANQPAMPQYHHQQQPQQPQQPQQQQYGYPAQDGYAAERSPAANAFPVLRDPPPNVPPADEDRQANLERAREAVLASTDPEMQVAWAQDCLSCVEVAVQNEARMAAIQPPRPQTPPIEHRLRTDAINIVSFLADQGHPRAEFIRGMWLEFGKFGFQIDKKEAFRCYSRSAENGYARAEYRMGMQFESSNEPLKAIKHYEKGVSLGDSASYYRLGMMILLGQHGQQQDYATGLDYIRYAAQTCDENAPQGAYVCGMLLARELPQVAVPEQYLSFDPDNARINIEKAAYHGFAKAQVKMGAAYELCQLGCDFNPALSLHYNALAARQGEPEAEMAISKWFLCGHEGLFEKNDETAFNYARRAAQDGVATAEFALGYFYEIGIYVNVDIKEARVWYAKAAANGNKDASSRIDSISRSKTLSRKDHETVAISRIKSQYASHGRGSQRYSSVSRNQAPPQQAAALEMPDPSKMSLSDGPPPRSASAVPYPDGPTPGYGSPAPDPTMRSSSAFGVNPRLQAQAASPGPRMASAGGYPPPRGHGPQQGGYPGSYQGGHPGSPQPAGGQKLDVGFSAPHDPTGADGRRRLKRPDGQGGGRGGHGGRAPNAQPTPPPSSRPPRTETKPQTPSSAGGSPSQSGQQKATNTAGLPGKGPKTFEEMGVPQAKNNGDCVVM